MGLDYTLTAQLSQYTDLTAWITVNAMLHLFMSVIANTMRPLSIIKKQPREEKLVIYTTDINVR